MKHVKDEKVLTFVERECRTESLISFIRFTQDAGALGNALRLLTAVAPRIPVSADHAP